VLVEARDRDPIYMEAYGGATRVLTIAKDYVIAIERGMYVGRPYTWCHTSMIKELPHNLKPTKLHLLIDEMDVLDRELGLEKLLNELGIRYNPRERQGESKRTKIQLILHTIPHTIEYRILEALKKAQVVKSDLRKYIEKLTEEASKAIERAIAGQQVPLKHLRKEAKRSLLKVAAEQGPVRLFKLIHRYRKYIASELEKPLKQLLQ